MLEQVISRHDRQLKDLQRRLENSDNPPLYSECEFEVRNNLPRGNCVIDLVALYENKIEIYEHKTVDKPKYRKKAGHQLRRNARILWEDVVRAPTKTYYSSPHGIKQLKLDVEV